MQQSRLVCVGVWVLPDTPSCEVCLKLAVWSLEFEQVLTQFYAATLLGSQNWLACFFSPCVCFCTFCSPALSPGRCRPFPSPGLRWRTWAPPLAGCRWSRRRQCPMARSRCQSRSQSERKMDALQDIIDSPLIDMIPRNKQQPLRPHVSNLRAWTVASYYLRWQKRHFCKSGHKESQRPKLMKLPEMTSDLRVINLTNHSDFCHINAKLCAYKCFSRADTIFATIK